MRWEVNLAHPHRFSFFLRVCAAKGVFFQYATGGERETERERAGRGRTKDRVERVGLHVFTTDEPVLMWRVSACAFVEQVHRG